MALLRNLRAVGALRAVLKRQGAHVLSRQIDAAQFVPLANFASSSEDEDGSAEGGKRSKSRLDDAKSREEYRTWVENMLTAIQTQPGARRPAEQAEESGAGTGADDTQPIVSAEAQADGASTADSSTAAGPSSEEASAAEDSEQIEPSPSRPVPTRTTMREDVNVLPDAVVGFQELGISSTGGDAALLDQGQGSINRFRRFTPAESYDPEDLVASIRQRGPFGGRSGNISRVKKATSAEARVAADFRNVGFLNRFTSETGQLPPRRVTRLKKSVHVHVMKQIKIARQMALLPHEGKLKDLQQQ